MPLWRLWVSGAAAAAVSDVMMVSSLFRLQDQIGGMIACADRAFDRRWQAGIGPVAGQKQILQFRRGTGTQRILLWRRLERRAAFAHDLPRRQRPLGHLSAKTSYLADVAPDVARKLLARQVDETFGGADGDRQPVGRRGQPFDQTADYASQCRNSGRRNEPEMCVKNGAELGRRLDAGQQPRRRTRGHRQNNNVIRSERDRILAEIQARGAQRRTLDLAQLMSQRQRAALLPDEFDRSSQRRAPA